MTNSSSSNPSSSPTRHRSSSPTRQSVRVADRQHVESARTSAAPAGSSAVPSPAVDRQPQPQPPAVVDDASDVMGLNRFRLLVVATVLITPIYIGLDLHQLASVMIPEDYIVGSRSHRASAVSEFWEDASNHHKSQTCFFVGSHGDLRLLNKEVVESFDIIFTDRTDFSQYGWTPDYLYTEDRMFLERNLLTPALNDTVTFVRKDWVVPTAMAESHATNTTEKMAGITAQWLWSPPSGQVLNTIGKNVLEGGEAVLLNNGVVPFTAMDSCKVSKKNVVESCSYTSVENGDGDGELGVVGKGSDRNF